MVRIILIGIGLVTSAIAGFYAKQKLSRVFSEDADPWSEEPAIYRPSPRPGKSHYSPVDQALENGEHDEAQE